MAETLEQRILSLEKVLSAQPQSPLFAQLAAYYLEAGRSQDALKLCDSGLATHPFYTTGHLIKGKTLLALNMRSEARREFEFVHQMLPMNETVSHLLAGIAPSPDESFVDRPVPPVEEPPAPAPQEPAAAEEQPVGPEAAADQWMSQFTEETPSAPVEPGPQPQSLEPEATSSSQTPGELTRISEPSEDPFGLSTPDAPAEQPVESAIEPASGIQPEIPEVPAAESPMEQPFEPPVEQPSLAVETGESFEDFAERKRGELFGMEHTLSLEDYLAEQTQGSADSLATSQPEESPVFGDTSFSAASPEEPSADPFAGLTSTPEPETFAAEPPAEPMPAGDPFAPTHGTASEEPRDQIEELAEKLKNAKKITPVINLSDRTSVPASESETPAGTGFVTPTLAEIYAKQGWYDDAIKAYKTLAINKPAEREKYDARIAELEQLKKQQEGG